LLQLRTVSPRLLPAALAALIAVLMLPGAAGAQGDPEPLPVNPCERPLLDLLCPDLSMSPPYDLRIDRTTRRGRVLLRAANSINSRGLGPAELFGTRSGPSTAGATQKIQRSGGGTSTFETGARLGFKSIPGQGRYWKYADAARFEIWTVDGLLRPLRRIRTGPKVYYCLRDLKRTRPMARSPRRFHYPRCNQSAQMRHVALGTSVGWSDIYPATYHEQWIDVTRLRGTFAFKHVADPENGIWESDEANNEGVTIVKLPSGRAVSRTTAGGEDPYARPQARHARVK
jgi:hypothetical protein